MNRNPMNPTPNAQETPMNSSTPTPQTNAGRLLAGHKAGDALIRTTNRQEMADEGLKPAQEAFKAWREAAGITWRYVKTQATNPITGEDIPNKFWIQRQDKPQAIWGPVTGQYGLTQHEALDALAGVLLAEGAIVRSALVLDNGGRVAITTEMQQHAFKAPGGQTIQAYAHFLDSHDVSAALTGALSMTDPVCRNTLAHAVYGGIRRWTLQHRANIATRISELREMGREMARNGAHADAYRQQLYGFAETRISLDEAIAFFRRLRATDQEGISPKARRGRQNRVDQDVAIYREAPSAAPGSFYGLDQWQTNVATHVLANRATREDQGQLLEYTVLGGGSAWQEATASMIQLDWAKAAKAQGQLQTVQRIASQLPKARQEALVTA